jgi:hypothetical protein
VAVIDPLKAVEYIIKNSPAYAKAKADRVHLEEFRKSKKALLMSESTAEAANAREQYAYAHPDYIQLLDGLKQAVETEETLKWMLTAAQMKVEVWRTMEASNRRQDGATR